MRRFVVALTREAQLVKATVIKEVHATFSPSPGVDQWRPRQETRIAGLALAQWMGRRVFGTSITPRWEIFPLTIALMVVVSMAGALPLRRLGKIKPAVILRGE